MTMIVGMRMKRLNREWEEEGFTSMNSGIMDYDNDCGNEDEKIK